jgi:hypothetical protein
MLVLVQQGMDHLAGHFLLDVCIRIAARALRCCRGLGVVGILSILIYTPYRKNQKVI